MYEARCRRCFEVQPAPEKAESGPQANPKAKSASS
jgi:hypothetical protein